MFTGFVQYADGRIETTKSLDEFRRSYQQQPERFWVDMECPQQDEVRQFGELLGLSEEAVEDCLEGEQRPRIDDYDDYFLMVLYGVVPPEGEPADRARKLVLLCSPKFLMSVHPESLRTTNAVRRQCNRRNGACISQGVDRLTFRLVDGIVDNYLALIDECDDQVESIEERSFELADEDSLLQDVAHMRHRLLEFRRLATAQRTLIEAIARGDYEFISSELRVQYLHVSEHLMHALDRNEVLRDRLTGALHNYHSTLAKRTNDIMRVLTVFAAVMLPLTLIAGIYGMNVPTWPSDETPQSFWAILGVMAVIGGGLLWYFRRRRWL
jgi:magnesium transporter